MNKLVTIGIPIYKRLEFLPNALKVVAAQDYPHIDLLVSDNGLNGSAVPDIVNRHISRPYRFRQNAATVGISTHFTQLMQNAEGEYFVVLADDDEISPNFVSELVTLLEKYPRAAAAFGREETIDQSGKVVRTSKEAIPEVLSDTDFIRSTWSTREYGLTSLCTFLAQTERLLACGGFPEIFGGTSDEDLLMVKMCLGGQVAFSTRCSFRKRLYETSMGYAQETQDLARGIREFVTKMDSDPQILAYAETHPDQWKELRGYLFDSAWETYWFRWADLYRRRLPALQWARAGFALPVSYHPRVARFLLGACRAAMFAPASAPSNS